MTGGTEEAENINAQLAIAAEELKIPIGVGSQRQALENVKYRKTYSVIRKQIVKAKNMTHARMVSEGYDNFPGEVLHDDCEICDVLVVLSHCRKRVATVPSKYGPGNVPVALECFSYTHMKHYVFEWTKYPMALLGNFPFLSL